MLLQFLSLHRSVPLVSYSFLFNNRTISSSFDDNDINLKRRKRSSPLPLRAVENDSEFELDRKKALEALQQLDLQLQSLSKKEPPAPKRRVSTPNLDSVADRASLMREELPEFSGSYLAYSAFALLFFSIFYNVIFITIIKPSVDGPEPEAAPLVSAANTTIREAPNAAAMESPPVASQD
ncbi:hypothetical protein BVC80_373g12 [Macleaya cordata]|uniref:Transmembrane protein n=1 Tax=Macleaya cordata TaxID=56857 RepID=A0A200QT34_MACCD|nr:hypothetical protein BVC80_373g12 [Macleaya cordata]